MKSRTMFAAAAALLLVGCDAAAGVQFNMKMAEMEREQEEARAKLDAMFPASMPTAPAGEYRVTVMRDGAVKSTTESCYPERTIRQLMSIEIDAPTIWCPIDGQSVKATGGGWQFHAACDFTEVGQDKQDVTTTVTGGLRSSFTVKRVKVTPKSTPGKPETFTTKWDYRGAC